MESGSPFSVVIVYQPIYPGITTQGESDARFRAEIQDTLGCSVIGEPDVHVLPSHGQFGPESPQEMFRFIYHVEPREGP